MTAEQIDALLTGEEGARADGTFQLVATRAGTVIQDAFIEGEFVEPGRALFEISDETRVWVEASLMPEEALGIEKGSPARVRLGGEWLTGVVIQSHHAVNEITRTLAVRIEVPNPDERLHPGLFVETRIEAGSPVDALALPREAVLRSPDGDWMIIVEDEPDHYRPVEVEVSRTVQGLAVIEGVPAGTRVVTKGAFFIQSELAKSGFDVHNH
jgi:multidrug efflux pump subunit AcrA (membrane-fusion protein)